MSTPADLGDFVPVLRDDFERRDIDGNTVVWSPLAPDPTVLEPVAAVMLDVVDGAATVRELVIDVHEVLGIPITTARDQVVRVVEEFGRAGLLTASASATPSPDPGAVPDQFVADATPCSEESSRLGTVTLVLDLGGHLIRVASDSRKAAKTLHRSLAAHVAPDIDDRTVALGFVLTAPQGLKRTHKLVDRTGFVLSTARGLDSGLAALACNLTGFMPPQPGTVRIKARAIVRDEQTILCLFPHLYFPAVSDREVDELGFRLVDRLSLDIDPATGEIVNTDVPWPELAALEVGRGHVGTGGRRRVTGIVNASPTFDGVPSSRADLVAEIAAAGLAGSRSDLLDAAVALVTGTPCRSTRPVPDAFPDAVRSLTGLDER